MYTLHYINSFEKLLIYLLNQKLKIYKVVRNMNESDMKNKKKIGEKKENLIGFANSNMYFNAR